MWPGITLLTLVMFYGAFALIDGVLAIAAAVMGGQPALRWWLAIVGLLGIAVGILTFMWPGITAVMGDARYWRAVGRLNAFQRRSLPPLVSRSRPSWRFFSSTPAYGHASPPHRKV